MTDRPVRVQRKRVKGWRLPPNTVCVDRSTNFGNPYQRKEYTGAPPKLLVDLFRDWLTKSDDQKAVGMRKRMPALRGKNLACWCRFDQECHADVLLELANGD